MNMSRALALFPTKKQTASMVQTTAQTVVQAAINALPAATGSGLSVAEKNQLDRAYRMARLSI